VTPSTLAASVRAPTAYCWHVSALDIGRFLRDYSGALSALAALILIIVTAQYVHLTHLLSTAATEQVREAARARIDNSMPDVHAYAELTRVGDKWNVLCRIRNERSVLAYVDLEPLFECTLAPPHTLDGNCVFLHVRPESSVELTFTSNTSDIEPQGILFRMTASGKVLGAHDLFYWSIEGDLPPLGKSLIVKAFHEGRVYSNEVASKPVTGKRKPLRG